MNIRDVYRKIDALYPKRLSDDYVAAYGGRDNSGILIDAGGPVTGALFSLDFSQKALDAAPAAGANLIVSHHPAIFFPIASLRAEDPLGARLLRAAKEGVGVISMHLNFDCAAGGIDESLARAAGGQGTLPPCQPLEGGGYGRVFALPAQPFSAFAEKLCQTLGTARAFLYGPARTVRSAASFCGAGIDAEALAFARRGGADVVVSADIKHNFIADALEAGLNVVQLTHYASENYGFKILFDNLKGKLGVPCTFFCDDALL